MKSLVVVFYRNVTEDWSKIVKTFKRQLNLKARRKIRNNFFYSDENKRNDLDLLITLLNTKR